MKKTKTIAISGILSAVSVCLLFLGGIVPSFTYVMPLLASVIMIVMLNSATYKDALTVFAVTSILSMILVADKESVLTYLLVFGYYPIIKMYLEKIPVVWFRVLFKFIFFNTMIVVTQIIITFVFLIPFDNVFGPWGIVLLFVLANLTFLIYDKLLSMLMVLYNKKYKSRFSKFFN